jgi:hypothetical protein
MLVRSVLLSLVTVTALVLGGASAAMATPTTAYSQPVQVPGVTGVTGDKGSWIEFGGLLYVTVDAGDGTYALNTFDGTTFTPLPGSPANARNFVIWNGQLFFSGLNGDDRWEIYSFDGTTFEKRTDVHDSINLQELVVGTDNELFFTADGAGTDTMYSTFNPDAALTGQIFTSPRMVADAISNLVFFDNWVWYTSWMSDVVSLRQIDGTSGGEVGIGLECDAGLVWQGALYRNCFNDPLGSHLWVTHAGGAFFQVPGSPAAPYELTAFDDELFFVGLSELDSWVLFSFDGNTFTEVEPTPDRPADLVVVGDVLMMTYGHYKGSLREGITAFNGASFTELTGLAYSCRGLISYGGALYFSALLDPGVLEYSFFRVTLGVAPEPELAKTGVSAGAASASLMSGLVGGGLLLAGLGFLVLRRRGLLLG